MNSKASKDIESPNTQILVKEAQKRGISFNYIPKFQRDIDFLELSFGKHYEYIKGQRTSKTSCIASYTLEDKSQTKYFLSRSGINVVKGKLFYKSEIDEAYKFIEELKYSVVVKKNDGAHGDLVFLNVNNRKSFNEAASKILKNNDYILVEKKFKGKEYRFIASRYKFFAATYKEPANIIGDGVHNIKELIRIRNNHSNSINKNNKFLVKLEINNIIKQNLSEQNLSLYYIPLSDEKIYLRKNSNISTGGESTDVTDIIHPEFRKIAVKAVCAIPGLAHAGIDIMTNRDISLKPTKNSYVIIEMNSSPGLLMHHFPFNGKPRDVAKEIIDILFPETKRK